MALSADGGTVFVAFAGAAARAFDVAGHAAPRDIDPGRVYALALSPDGKVLATAGREVVLYSAATLEKMLTLRFVARPLPGDFTAVAFADPGAERAMGAGSDPDPSSAYAFTPDGYVAFIGDDTRAYPACRVGSLTFPIDLCAERFVVQDLLQRVLAGDTSYRDP
jgi:hypothetical protein